MNIGSRVRFLSDVGGGIVVGFDKKGWALVEDEDGFQIPMPKHECVVVEESVVGKSNAAATISTTTSLTKTAKDIKKSSSSTSQEGGAAIISGAKYIQTTNGDNLNVALVYTKSSEPVAGAQSFLCTLANESNYNLLATYTIMYKGESTLVYAGEILPFERKVLFSFGREALSDGAKKVLVRLTPFKRVLNSRGSQIREGEFNIYKGVDEKKCWQGKSVVEKEFTLDTVNLLKEGAFKDNGYVSERGYVVAIIREGFVDKEAAQELKKELYEKFRGDAKGSNGDKSNPNKSKSANKNNATPEGALFSGEDPLVKVGVNGVFEVDLHIHELLDNTAGMNNADMLKYQIDTFNKVMIAHLHKRGTRIVFIHGKGDGVLRNAIVKELKNKYSNSTWQDASFREYGFGATMVRI